MSSLEFTCIYCNGKATTEMMLIRVYAPGTYFQHWRLDKNKGCEQNTKNIAPNGQIVKPNE